MGASLVALPLFAWAWSSMDNVWGFNGRAYLMMGAVAAGVGYVLLAFAFCGPGKLERLLPR